MYATINGIRTIIKDLVLSATVKFVTNQSFIVEHPTPMELIDDADVGAAGSTYDLPVGSAGIGEILVGNSEEYAKFTWDSSDVVDLLIKTDGVIGINDDDKFCIFDNTGKVSIRNRLGSTKKMMLILHRTTP